MGLGAFSRARPRSLRPLSRLATSPHPQERGWVKRGGCVGMGGRFSARLQVSKSPGSDFFLFRSLIAGLWKAATFTSAVSTASAGSRDILAAPPGTWSRDSGWVQGQLNSAPDLTYRVVYLHARSAI